MFILFKLSLFLWLDWRFLKLMQQSRRSFLINSIGRLVIVGRIPTSSMINKRKGRFVLFRLERPSDLTLSAPTLLLRLLLIHQRGLCIYYWQVRTINSFHHPLFILDDVLYCRNARVFVVDLLEIADSIVTTWRCHAGFYCACGSNYPCHQLPVL